MTASQRSAGPAEDDVLAVLAGTPLAQVADRTGVDAADLADAVDAYQAAGRAALSDDRSEWYQVRIGFTGWDDAEEVAANQLGPYLLHAEEAGTVGSWWWLRKHPHWRLRCRPGTRATRAETATSVATALDALVATGTVQRWTESRYEPEALAFGGTTGIDITHDHFHADSRGALAYLRRRSPVGRRELSILLCTALYRGARQDVDEQADVWNRIAAMRPLTTPPPVDRLQGMLPSIHRLTSLDGPAFARQDQLRFAASWLIAFTTTGSRLADATRDGALERGLRDVLAKLVIFHWNRLGIPNTAQAVLARAARDALLSPARTTVMETTR